MCSSALNIFLALELVVKQPLYVATPVLSKLPTIVGLSKRLVNLAFAVYLLE